MAVAPDRIVETDGKGGARRSKGTEPRVEEVEKMTGGVRKRSGCRR